MIWMKIIFIIWVCTLSSTQAGIADILDRIFFRNIKAFFKSEDTSTSIEIVYKERVDLTALPHDDFKFCKHMVLLYCSIIDIRFLDRQRPIHWHSLEELENLHENYNGPVPSDDELHDEPILIRKTAAFKRLSGIAFDLIVKYDALIQPKGYIDMAFYYNVLTWLQSNMPLSKKLLLQIKHIKKIKIKARNYFQEFTPFHELHTDRTAYVNPGINLADDKYKKIEGWENDDKHSIALAFLQDMIASQGEAAKSIPMKINDIDIYEEILNDADKEKFYRTMKIEKWAALRIIDRSFHVIYMEQLSHKPSNQITVQTLFTELDTELDAINLSNITPDSLRYYKYSAILFKEALELKIGRFLFANKQQYLDLHQYPERYQPNETLRYCTFQWWFSEVIQQMKFALSITNQTDKFLSRVYIYRMVFWLLFQVENENKHIDLCGELAENLVSLVADLRIATHPFIRLMNPENMKALFDSENKAANNLQKLLTLGEHHHVLLSSMLHIIKSRMEKDLEYYGQLKKILEEQKKTINIEIKSTNHTTAKATEPALHHLPQQDETNNPDQEASQQPEQHDNTTANQITVEDCDESITTIKWALYKLRMFFGEIEPKVRCEKFDDYKDLMDQMDQENIELVFFMDRQKLSDLIETTLKQTCLSDEVHNTKEDDHEASSYEEHIGTRRVLAVN